MSRFKEALLLVAFGVLSHPAVAAVVESTTYNFTYTTADLDIDRCEYDVAFATGWSSWLCNDAIGATGFAASARIAEPVRTPRIQSVDFSVQDFTPRSTFMPGERHMWNSRFDGIRFDYELGLDGKPTSWSGGFWQHQTFDGIYISSIAQEAFFAPGLLIYDTFQYMIDPRFFSSRPGTLTLNSVEYWCQEDDDLSETCAPLVSAPIPTSAPMLASAFGLLCLIRRRWTQRRVA